MELKKTENTIRGTIAGIINRLIGIVMPFILRTVMIKRLGADYAGLNGLFTSILSVLSLSELGFGDSIVFSMYKPIKDDDKDQLGKLVEYCRIVYRNIGIVILIAGLVLIPFIPHLVSGEIPSDMNLYILYCGFLLDTLINYFFGGYRVSLINAYQRQDITIGIQSAVFLVFYTIQICALLVFQNYYLYLVIMIMQTLTYTILWYCAAKKMYPDISPKSGLDSNTRKTIRNNVVGIAFHRVGDTVSTSLDSLVISVFIGLSAVTVFGNYNFVFIAVLSIMSIFFNVLTAGIGNKALTSELEENKAVFDELNYVSMRLTTFCCSCMMALYQPFMRAWVGEELTMPVHIAILFTVYFYVASSRKLVNTYKNALGMWLEDKWKSIVACVFNLIFNIVMIQKIGIAGVVLSTILSYAVVEIPWEVHILFRRFFNTSEMGYYKTLFTNCIETTLVSGAVYLIVQYYNQISQSSIVMQFILGILVSVLFIYLLHHKESAFCKIQDRCVTVMKNMMRGSRI